MPHEHDNQTSENATDARRATPTFTLRALNEGDRDEFRRVLRISRGCVGKHFPVARPGETDDQVFDRWIALTERTGRDLSGWRRVAVAASDTPSGPAAGTLLGAFNLINIERGLEWTADANWWVAADQRGRGIATAGVQRMLDTALAPLPSGLGLARVNVGIEPENDASRKVAQRCGFIEAKAPSVFLDKGDEWSKHDLYAAIAG